jgi:hypothetical protein
MTPEEELKRSREAGAILAQPIVTDTLDFMEREVMEAWITCPVRDVEGREALWRMAATVRKFRELLRGTMESGKLAQEKIRQKTAFERVKDVGQGVVSRFSRR